MEYERLTEKEKFEHLRISNAPYYKEIYETLQELEDKIENGTLIEAKKLNDFAERIKMEFYYEFDELIPSIMADKIDKILKELQVEK